MEDIRRSPDRKQSDFQCNNRWDEAIQYQELYRISGTEMAAVALGVCHSVNFAHGLAPEKGGPISASEDV